MGSVRAVTARSRPNDWTPYHGLHSVYLAKQARKQHKSIRDTSLMRPDHYTVNRVQVPRMTSGIIALVGDLHVDRQALGLIAAEFHWSVKQFRTIYELAQANVDNNLIAVLFDPKSLSLPRERALRVIL